MECSHHLLQPHRVCCNYVLVEEVLPQPSRLPPPTPLSSSLPTVCSRGTRTLSSGSLCSYCLCPEHPYPQLWFSAATTCARNTRTLSSGSLQLPPVLRAPIPSALVLSAATACAQNTRTLSSGSLCSYCLCPEHPYPQLWFSLQLPPVPGTPVPSALVLSAATACARNTRTLSPCTTHSPLCVTSFAPRPATTSTRTASPSSVSSAFIRSLPFPVRLAHVRRGFTRPVWTHHMVHAPVSHARMARWV